MTSLSHGRTFPAGTAGLVALLIALVLGVLVSLVTAVVPFAALVLGLLIALLCGGIWLYRFIAPGAPLWARAILLVVLGFVVINYGFANLVIDVGIKLTVSELVLLAALAGCLSQIVYRGQVLRPAALWFFLAWAAIALLLHLPGGYRTYGLVALRDALPTVQVFYVVPGLVIAQLAISRPENQRWGRNALAVLAVLAICYGLTFPFGHLVRAYSPQVQGMQQSVPLFGHYQTLGVVALTGFFGLLLWRWSQKQQGRSRAAVIQWVGLLACSVLFVLIQSRGAYVTAAAVVVLLAAVGHQWRSLGKAVALGLVALAALALVSFSEVEIPGRLGAISLEQIRDHLGTLILGKDEVTSEVAGAAAGIDQRMRWISGSLKMWREDWISILLGIGYGQPLTDHIHLGHGGEYVIVREPHNSYVTVLVRTGLIGFVVMMAFHAASFASALLAYRLNIRQGLYDRAALSLGLAVFLTCNLVNAVGQPNFENPHLAAPYFFACGIALALFQAARAQQPAAVADGPNTVS